MRAKLALLGVVAILALTAMACAGAEGVSEADTWQVNVSCDDFFAQGNITRNQEAGVGDTIIVALCSNPSTGFQWPEVAQIGDPTVLEQLEHKFVGPEAQEAVGVAGSEIWTFTALNKGTTTVSMEYSRPWEGGEKGVWTFVLTVTVE